MRFHHNLVAVVGRRGRAIGVSEKIGSCRGARLACLLASGVSTRGTAHVGVLRIPRGVLFQVLRVGVGRLLGLLGLLMVFHLRARCSREKIVSCRGARLACILASGVSTRVGILRIRRGVVFQVLRVGRLLALPMINLCCVEIC